MALDLQLDTSTEAGRLAAVAIVGVGGWEHDRISERTRAGLEAARSRGGAQGRTAVADIPELQERIARMRDEGMTLQAIADVLNEEGVPTLRGGAMWRPSSVQRATGYRRPSAATRGIELPKFKPPEL
jgi:DNA invertase Pin-like site-specific DNA recombinase